MAGGKETPRQRMIGMMYLVLTALLALQVSNQILQKFILLNEGMERTSGKFIEKNITLVDNIQSKLKEPGTEPRDLPLGPAALKVRASTKEIYDHLENLKTELIQLSNAKDDNGNFVNSSLKNTEVPGQLFANQPKGEELKKKLNEFPKTVEGILKGVGISGPTFSPIALDASEIELFANDMEARNKSFVTLNFVKSPVGAVIAILSQFQSDVLNIESDALGAISMRIGSGILPADKTKAVITSSSKYVVAGTKFEGEMFIAAYSSSVSPTMTFNNSPVVVGEEGVGKLEFVVPDAKDYDDKLQAKRSVNGVINYSVGGVNKTLETTFEYFIVKPVIKVSSTVVQQLYAECPNELTISVPSLGNEYSPQFTVTNGSLVSGSNGKVTIFPNASGKVSIGVKSKGIDIGTETFDIKPVPNPRIVLRLGSDDIDSKRSYPKALLSNLKVVAIAEANFASTLPNEKNYDTPEGIITLVRNDQKIAEVPIGGNLNSLIQNATSGDQISVEVTAVNRISPGLGRKVRSAMRESKSFRVK